MLIKRKIASRIESLSKQFPVIGILGPRQSGKTTLARMLFPHYLYVNLEDLDTRELAHEDPRRFLHSLEQHQGVILDEIQRVPDLLSYMQGYVDKNPRSGFFILTGSENILLNQHIGQTLAGRIALVTLLPLSLAELQEASLLCSLDETLFRGFYPSLYARPIEVSAWIQGYLQTYIERDIRHLKQIGDLLLFQKFLKLCAGRVGQLLDLSSIGNDCGISTHTVQSWLSLLEATYVTFRLLPHHKNFNKRIVKTPKLYFYDTALLCHLLSIHSEKELSTHYLRGNIFESMILADLMKQCFTAGIMPNLYFWRDKSGHEVDIVWEREAKLVPIEIKSAETIHSDFFSGLVKWKQLAGSEAAPGYLIYGGKEKQSRSQGEVVSWMRAAYLHQEFSTQS